MEYAIWYGSVALFIIGWCFIKFFLKHKRYFFSYLVFQLGITLLVVSIYLLDGWAAMGYAILSLYIMGFGLISAVIVFIFIIIRKQIASK